MPDLSDFAPPLVRDLDPAEQAEAEERVLAQLRHFARGTPRRPRTSGAKLRHFAANCGSTEERALPPPGVSMPKKVRILVRKLTSYLEASIECMRRSTRMDSEDVANAEEVIAEAVQLVGRPRSLCADCCARFHWDDTCEADNDDHAS